MIYLEFHQKDQQSIFLKLIVTIRNYLGTAEKLVETTKWLNVNNHPGNLGWDEIAPLTGTMKGFNIK